MGTGRGNRDRDIATLPHLGSTDYERIIGEGDPDMIVDKANQIGDAVREVKSSQIRGIFATVRQIQLSWDTNPNKAYRSAVLLKPRIAYSAKRNDLFGLDGVLVTALDHVKGDNDAERRKRFNHFTEFFEAIVAYHKVHGGK